MFLVPARVPHSNIRTEGSIGLVVHQSRAPGATEAIVWYCEECKQELHREEYVHDDVRQQLPVLIRRFFANERLRSCRYCGFVLSAPSGP